jgi:hypothetical protein
MPEKTSMPHCRRCHLPIAHPIVEKVAGEWIVRCLDCGTANVLHLTATSRVALPLFEIIGWMG